MGFFDKFKDIVGVLVEGKPPETEEETEDEKVNEEVNEEENEEGREQESKKEGKDEEQEGYEEVKGKTNNDEEKDKERVRIFVYGSVYKYIKDYGARLEIFDIKEGINNYDVKGKVYNVNFQMYGNHECFEVDTQILVGYNEQGEIKNKVLGESTITLIGEWISKLGFTSESETHTIKGDYREEIGRYIEKYRGLKNEVGYRPSYDGKDRERVVRMVKLLKESGLKVKVANNDKYGDYFMIPLGKEVNIISTPTLVIESTSNQVLYNKHSEGSNLEKSLGKVIKDKGDKELYNNAKDFIDIYNKANDLRRTLN